MKAAEYFLLGPGQIRQIKTSINYPIRNLKARADRADLYCLSLLSSFILGVGP